MASGPLASAAHRLALVEELEQSGAFRTASIRAAFLQVPRELFVPAFARSHGLEAVYQNRLIVTKEDAGGVPLSSSSEPRVMAAMLESLELEAGMRVLELGTGTGYNAALVKTVVGTAGRVVSIEIDRALAAAARRALRLGGFRLRVVLGDAHAGYERAAPFDRIVATASSAHVPRPWLDQLVEGGLLELPLRLRPEGALAIATFRRQGDRLESTSIVPGRFMPLRGDTAGAIHPAVLTVRSRLANGEEVLTRLGGKGVERLSARARETLVEVARTEPRVRDLGVRTPAWPLGLYLSLELPAPALVLRYADLAVGVVGRGGRGLALLEGRWEDGDRPGEQRLLAFGDADAEEVLIGTIEGWGARGRPGLDRLRVRATFDERRARIRHEWLDSPP